MLGNQARMKRTNEMPQLGLACDINVSYDDAWEWRDRQLPDTSSGLWTWVLSSCEKGGKKHVHSGHHSLCHTESCWSLSQFWSHRTLLSRKRPPLGVEPLALGVEQISTPPGDIFFAGYGPLRAEIQKGKLSCCPLWDQRFWTCHSMEHAGFCCSWML